jgi:MSHA pilin protein MshB
MKTLNMQKLKAAKQAGFTIIELVVVILLLGILTATALPRFIDVAEDAHLAVVDGVLGGLGTGATLFRAQWIADNQPVTAITEFGGLFPDASGYPSDLTDVATPGTSTLCLDFFRNVLQLGAQPVIGASGGTVGGVLGSGAGVGTFAAANLTIDWISHASTNGTGVCEYYYVGRAAAKVIGATVPYLIYAPGTGSVTLVAASTATT